MCLKTQWLLEQQCGWGWWCSLSSVIKTCLKEDRHTVVVSRFQLRFQSHDRTSSGSKHRQSLAWRFSISLSWPRPPRQPGQDERDEDGGEQVDRVVVQDGFPTDPLGGGGAVAHHLPDARVEAWGQRGKSLDERRPSCGGWRFTFPECHTWRRNNAQLLEAAAVLRSEHLVKQ